METTVETTIEAVAKQFPHVGSYGPLMKDIAAFLTNNCEIDEVKAHKAGHAAGCEFGKLMSDKRALGLSNVKIGNPNKDGQVNLGEAGSKIKGVYLTAGLLTIKLASIAKELEDWRCKDVTLTLPGAVTEWLEKF